MEPPMINVLISSFPGLGLPATLSLPTPASQSIEDLTSRIHTLIPSVDSRLILTTSRNKQLLPTSRSPVSSLLAENDSILSLRLSVPLCGGKGGFGSQLRAAGGRMTSKRRKNQGEQNGSSRNLDGRRLRTVNEAKALAEYLATKPEMDRKQKEARRKRWEQVIEAAERKEEEIKSGSKGRVDGQWVEDKEDAGERTREAVRAAMANGNYHDTTFKKDEATTSAEEKSSGSESGREGSAGSQPTTPEELTEKGKGKAKQPPRTFFGWDEDDEFMSDEDNEDDEKDKEVDEHGGSSTIKSAA